MNAGRAHRSPIYDRLSRWYDLVTGPFERRYRQAGLQQLSPQPGEAILELGFGTGHGLLALAQAVGSAGRVCGVDLSVGMCCVARGRLRRAHPAGRLALIRGDALRLPFRAGTFDALFMSFTLEIFSTQEIPRVLCECRRVLRPGGRLGVVAMAQPARPSATARLYTWLHQRFPRYLDCRPIALQEYLATAGWEVRSTLDLAMVGLPVAVGIYQ
jgi:demethylmenaquinone methyltransferase/2-methoxy-6-polyprenyl-1,4-benzoquinol methylase